MLLAIGLHKSRVERICQMGNVLSEASDSRAQRRGKGVFTPPASADHHSPCAACEASFDIPAIIWALLKTDEMIATGVCTAPDLH